MSPESSPSPDGDDSRSSHDGGLSPLADGHRLPDYGGYCIASVPGTVAAQFGVDVGPTLPDDVLPENTGGGGATDVEHVVVVLLDGLGLHRWRRDGPEHRFLGRLADRGTVTPLTSVAPSSTAAAITTLHTAATPAEHGVLGWDVHCPGAEAVVSAFPHEVRASAHDHATPSIPAGELVATDPIYPALAAAGVESHVVQDGGTLGTDYADATFRGAEQVPADDPATLAARLRERLESNTGPTYSYCYFAGIDTQSHEHGTDSGGYHDALASITRHLSRELYDELDPSVADETLLLVTADHGMIDFEPGPERCLDLGSIDVVRENLARWSTGDPIPPVADPRGVSLWIEADARETVAEALRARGADVVTRERAREMELYGPDPGTTFERRCGDFVVYHPEKKIDHGGVDVADKIGMHGGRTEREMIVPFAAARLSTLRDD